MDIIGKLDLVLQIEPVPLCGGIRLIDEISGQRLRLMDWTEYIRVCKLRPGTRKNFKKKLIVTKIVATDQQGVLEAPGFELARQVQYREIPLALGGIDDEKPAPDRSVGRRRVRKYPDEYIIELLRIEAVVQRPIIIELMRPIEPDKNSITFQRGPFFADVALARQRRGFIAGGIEH